MKTLTALNLSQFSDYITEKNGNLIQKDSLYWLGELSVMLMACFEHNAVHRDC